MFFFFPTTEKLRLKKSRTYKKPFQRNQEDVFEVDPEDVGIIDLCRYKSNDLSIARPFMVFLDLL